MEANGTALQPPQKRQPHTPPPKKEFSDVEAAHEMNGNVSTHGHVKMSTGGLEDLAICASPGDFATKVHARNRNGKSKAAATDSSDDSLAGMLRRGMVDHQLGLSLNLVLFVGLSWLLFPSLRQKMSAFFSLSYGVSRSGETMYGQGPRDMYFVISFIVLFTGIRAFMLDYVLVPLAGLWGIGRRKGRVRFAEQSYLLLYYSLYWTWGLCLFVKGTASAWPSPAPSSSPIANLLISLWTDFPKLYLPASMKIYYLSQLAFWAQQIVVIHLEEKRKDHYQMLTHHLVTVALVSTSYGYKQWRSGNAVLVCMDIVEIVFPLAKILKYLGWQTACDATFVVFVLTWVAARHVGYLTICWSIYAHVNVFTMNYGTYSLRSTTQSNSNRGLQISSDGGEKVLENIFQPLLDPTAQTIGFNAWIRWGFLGLLLSLQCITILWFVMICRVIMRVLQGKGADDTRSDDEGEDEGVLEDGPGPVQPSLPFIAAEEKPKFIEVESTASDLMYTPRRSGSGSKRKSKGGGFSSSLHLGDHKDILNRIGCLSEEQLAREREKRDGSEGPRPTGSRR